MNKTLLFVGASALLLSSNANAFDTQQYVSAKLTYSDATHDIGYRDFEETDKLKFGDEVLGGSFAYGIKNGALRTEIELNLKDDAKEGYEGGTSTMENNSVMLNAYYDINTGTRLTPYIGGGVGVAYNKAGIKSESEFSKSKTNFAWQLGGGLSYALTANVDIDAGYRYSDTGNVKMRDGDSVIKYESESHEFLLGIRYTF